MQKAQETLELHLAFGRDVQEDEIRAREFYSALCNNRWMGRNNQIWEFTWRQAGDFVASIRNKREDAEEETYLDYYASGSEGMVAPWVKSRFAALGYERDEG